MRTFEDLHVGERLDLGTVSVSEAEILAFGREYDPQPFHVDPDAAAASPYGGLIASGWQTGSLYMRLLATGFLNDTASLGSPGLEELRWPAPVRPGDTLHAALEILETRPSASRPTVGIIRSRGTLTNADGALVMSVVAINFIARRDGTGGDGAP